ncbi:hypothetical protein SRHO_G00242600 [Serrasalmus rhombeus]
MVSPSSVYESLTRRHGVKVVCRASVEECCLAAGAVVSHSNIVSASRMNSAVVDLANDLVQSGVVINGQLTPVLPLSTPLEKAAADPPANPEPEGGEPSVVQSAAEETAGAEWAMEAFSSSAPTVPEPALVEPEGGTAISEGQAAEVSGCSEPVSAEVVMLEAVAEVDMVDEPVFKVPAKRKTQGKGKGNKQPKKELSGADADTDSEGSLSDSGWSVCSQEERLPVRYTAEEIKKFLSVTKGYRGVQQWWDVAKVQIKVFCQQYTFNVTRDIIRSLKALEIEIVALQCLREATGHQEHITALKRKKAVLADLLGITAQGALVRSRFRNVTELDAPSKFFFGLERKNRQKRFMHAVRSESGDLISEPSEIRQQTVSFFSKLFESEWASCRDVEERFFPLQARITQQSATLLDAELSLEELHEALQGMENGRAPGIDGLPVEFSGCA